MAPTPVLPDDYAELLERLKREIGSARTRAALAVNEELIGLYWKLGREILARQEQEGWGTRVAKRRWCISLDMTYEGHQLAPGVNLGPRW